MLPAPPTSAIEGADCIVVTSGSPRKPGMSRDDLLKINAGVMNTVGKAIKEHAPDAFVIAVTNPLDAMVTQLKRVTGWRKDDRRAGGRARFGALSDLPRDGVEGVGAEYRGDGARRSRRRHGAGAELYAVGGVPVERLINGERLEEIEKRTRNGGAEIVNLMKTSSYYAAGTAVYQMVEAFILDRKQVLPCAAYLDGEYGVKGLFAGVPVVIGAGGVERVIEIALTDAEKKSFDSSVAHVRELVEAMDKVLAARARGSGRHHG